MKEEVSNSAHKQKATPNSKLCPHCWSHKSIINQSFKTQFKLHTNYRSVPLLFFNISHYIGGTYLLSNQSHVETNAFAAMQATGSQCQNYADR
jgi:hypothetical protein